MFVRHPGRHGCSSHKHSGRPHSLFTPLLARLEKALPRQPGRREGSSPPRLIVALRALTGCGTPKEPPRRCRDGRGLTLHRLIVSLRALAGCGTPKEPPRRCRDGRGLTLHRLIVSLRALAGCGPWKAPLRHIPSRGSSRHPLLAAALLGLAGCGTLKELPLSDMDSGSFRYRSASPPSFTPTEEPKAESPQAARAQKQRVVREDALVEVLLRAGLTSASERLPVEAPLSPEEAATLFDALLEQPITAAGFGPRLVASRLLREVVEGDEEVPRAELLERVKRFERLAVLRPDGMLVMALTGEPRQRVGEPQWNDGSFRAGGFQVGALYSGATGQWRPVDAALQRGWDSPALAEVRDDLAPRRGGGSSAQAEVRDGLAPRRGGGSSARAEVRDDLAPRRGGGSSAQAEVRDGLAPRRGGGSSARAEVRDDLAPRRDGGSPSQAEVRDNLAPRRGEGRPSQAEMYDEEAPARGGVSPATARGEASPQRDGASPEPTGARAGANRASPMHGGAEETFIDLVLALGPLLPASGDRLMGLSQLPEALATLISTSPAYLERFEQLTRGEQVRELSQLSATLLSTWGTVAGTPRTLAALGRGWEASRIPVLSLAADGTLAVERVAVPVGRAVTVLGDGPGAVAILHLASPEGTRQPEPVGGPGRWGPSRQLLSPRAARYQEQLSGHPPSEAYWLGAPGPLRFDAFAAGVLLEARGPGLASRFDENLRPKPWFARWGARELVEQARRQHAAARIVGARVRWHVAEERAAKALQRLFDANQLSDVEVVHTPAL
jgi:hypothetical protein